MSKKIKENVGFFSFKWSDIGLSHNNDPEPVRYYFAGSTDKDGKISGLGCEYAGGAAWQDFFIYKNIFIPSTGDDGECLEDEEMLEILRKVAGKTFVDSCYSLLDENIESKYDNGWIYFTLTSKAGPSDDEGFFVQGDVNPPVEMRVKEKLLYPADTGEFYRDVEGL